MKKICARLFVWLLFVQTYPGSFLFGQSYNPGNALRFDGASGYASIRDTAVLKPVGPFTLEAWVKREAGGSGNPTILDKKTYFLKFDGTGASQRILFGLGVKGVAMDTLRSSRLLAVNRWVHIAAVYANGQMQLILDGNLDASKTKTGLDSTTVDSLILGRNVSLSTDYFQGRIDELRIWNVVRDTVQIRSSMVQTVSIPQTGLVGYWRMDDLTGPTIADSSGNKNIGKLQGGTSLVSSSIWPVIPKNITAIYANNGLDSVHWNATISPNVIKYLLVKRSYLSSVFSSFDSVASGVLSYGDTSIINGFTYYYAVLAVDNNGFVSDTSDIASASVPPLLSNVVSSDISANTVWNKSNGVYLLKQNRQVTAAATLTINSGTIVQFDPGVSLTVNGVLQALGAVGDTIRFTTSNSNPAKGQWGALRFDNTSSPSVLRCVVVEYGGDTVITSDINSMRLRISNSLIWRNKGGIKHSGTSLDSITSSSVVQNNTFGIYATNNIVIFADTVMNNGSYGTRTKGNVFNSLFSQNGGNGIDSSGMVFNTTASHNTGYGISCSGYVYGSTADSNVGYGIKTIKSAFQCLSDSNKSVGIMAGDTVLGCIVFNDSTGVVGGKLIRQNQIYSNTKDGIYENTATGIVDSNRIYLNSGAGINSNNISGTVIRRNIIYRNPVGISYVGSHSVIQNNTLALNDTGIVTNAPLSADSLRNNIVAFGTRLGIFDKAGSNDTVDFNDVYSNVPGFVRFSGFSSQVGSMIYQNTVHDSTDLFGNITVDPLFANASINNFLLSSPLSHAINAGDPSSPKDPDNTISDLGANYYVIPSTADDCCRDGWRQECDRELGRDDGLSAVEVSDILANGDRFRSKGFGALWG